jgi:uncharacterized protein YbgA (DUF1722 family)
MIIIQATIVIALTCCLLTDWIILAPYRDVWVRGVCTRQIMDFVLRFPKWILRLPKKHRELTELASAQEDKEIEVIIQELDKELAERNG